MLSKTRRVVGTAVVDKNDLGVGIWEATCERSERGNARASLNIGMMMLLSAPTLKSLSEFP